MKKIIIMLLSLLCFCSSAFATNWQWVTSSDKYTISVNADNITRINDVYSAWFSIVYLDYAQPTYQGKKVKALVQRFNFQRTELGDEFRTTEGLFYDNEGNVLTHQKELAKWGSIIPGSFGETMFKKVLEIRATQDKTDDEKLATKKAEEEQKAADAKAEADKKAKREKQIQRNKETANAILGVGGALLGGLL